MKKLLCLLFAAFLLCVSASALELPSGLDDVVPRELIDSAEAGDDLLLRGGQYLFSHFRAALQDAVANSLRGAMALMLLSLLCGLIEGTAESAGETPTRYAGYLGVLGAAALGDIGHLFPDTDDRWKGADSLKLLEEVVRVLADQGYQIENIDATLLAQRPKLAPYIDEMRGNIADACRVDIAQVSVKATTEEGMGFTGTGAGMAAHAVALIEKA